jgi:hypothetical protein
VTAAQGTQDAFHDALREYSQAGATAAASGQLLDPAELAESTGLTDAARAHVKAARPLDDIKAEYDVMQAARDAGEPVDYEAMQALADELQPVRAAVAVLRGNYPGTGHTASAGIGA